MAQALLADYCEKRSLNVKVSSAGISALVDHAADAKAIELMSLVGIDITGHKARQLTDDLIADSDLILVMELGHIKAINDMAPQSRGRVHLIGKWNENEEIADPYRKSEQHFKAALSAIERGVKGWEKYL